MSELHSALRTEVVGRENVENVNFVLVRLQSGKTETRLSVHAEPTGYLNSAIEMAALLNHLDFKENACSFVAGKKCLARELTSGIDFKDFVEGIGRCFREISAANSDLSKCGLYIFDGDEPDFLSQQPYGDGHNSPQRTHMRISEDEIFKYALTFITGGADKGWTIHYRPQHSPLSDLTEASFQFLKVFRSFVECPEFEFDDCHWRFITFQEGGGRYGRSNADFIQRIFDFHKEYFAPGVEKLIKAHSEVSPYGIPVLPVRSLTPSQRLAQSQPVSPKRKINGLKYDVALSFAGSDREIAEALANGLRQNDVEVFYDRFYSEHLWGKDLTIEFDNIYRKESRYCVIFISQEYVHRMWTINERRSALARFLQERGKDYILPIKVEEVDLPGLPPTIGYLDLKSYPINEITEILLRKLREKP